MTVDVSRRGFRIEMPQVFVPGSLVHGYVLDGERQLPFTGEVTWAQPGNPQASTYSAMGVRFTELSPALAKLL
ncbi:MAG: PilZ domain-containing protein [Myxococcota bacterium]